MNSDALSPVAEELARIRTRLDRMETQARRWKRGTFSLLLLLGLVGLTAAQEKKETESSGKLTLEELTVRDPKTGAYAQLHKNPFGMGLTFFDAKGNPDGGIFQEDQNLIVWTTGPVGEIQTAMSLEKKGVGFVALSVSDRPQIGQNAIRQVPGEVLERYIRLAKQKN